MIHPTNKRLSGLSRRRRESVFISCLCLPGRRYAQLKRHRPVCPPKPADLAQRTKVPGGHGSLPNLAPAGSASSSTYSRHSLQRRCPIIPDTVKLPPGVHPQSASSPQTPPGTWAFNYFRKKEQPGRRKDVTQSLYIDGPECDVLLRCSSSPPSSASSPTSTVAPATEAQHHDPQAPKGQRRFSEPDIPYTDEDA